MPQQRASRTSASRRRVTRLTAADRRFWDEQCEKLRELLKDRPKGRAPGVPPSDTRSGRLRSFVYRFVRRLKRRNRLGIIARVVYGLDFEPNKVDFATNPYYWALYAFENEEKLGITIKDMSRFSIQMLYAERHDIEPELLVGFIYQQGNDNALAGKVASGQVEAWLAPYMLRRVS